MKILRTRPSYVLNLQLGKTLDSPLSFDLSIPGIPQFPSGYSVSFEIYNNPELFQNENALREYHSNMGKKQEIGYNPFAPAKTGEICVNYPDFDPELAYRINEAVNIFLNNFLSYALSFFQRRRILLGSLQLIPSEKYILTFPTLLAGERVDAVAYGPPLVDPSDFQAALKALITEYTGRTTEQRISLETLLMRYVNSLHLPYDYERIESYWKIIEFLGEGKKLNQPASEHFDRIRKIGGIKKNSAILRKFIITLTDYSIPLDDEMILKAFRYRNILIHEYLDHSKLKGSESARIFMFLMECVERIILSELGAGELSCTKPRYSTIEGRVF